MRFEARSKQLETLHARRPAIVSWALRIPKPPEQREGGNI